MSAPAYVFDGTDWVGRDGKMSQPVVVDATYGPVRVSLAGATTSAARMSVLRGAGLDIPTDAELVMWPHANPDGAFVNAFLDSLTVNQIGILPEATRADGSVWPYRIDSSRGFERDATHYYWMCVMKRGLVGLGPNTRLETSASSFTAPQQSVPYIDPFDGTTKTGVQNKVISCSTPNPYFGNMECRSLSYGGVAYNFVSFNKGIYCVERMLFRGAGRGFKNSPNGEAGALSCNTGNIRLIRRVEADQRDPDTGLRVSASPIMFNNQNGWVVEDSYLHHAIAGMPTAWHSSSTAAFPGKWTRVRSEYNGRAGTGFSGQNGHQLNFEIVSGTVEVQGPGTLISNYLQRADANEPHNSGLHIGGGSDEARCTVNIRNMAIDQGPQGRNIAGTSKVAADGTFTLAVQLFGYTPQYGLQINRYDAAGNPLPVFTYGTVTA